MAAHDPVVFDFAADLSHDVQPRNKSGTTRGRDPKVVETLPCAPALLENLRISKERARVPQWPDIQEPLRIEGAKSTMGSIPIPDAVNELKASINTVMST